MNDHEPNAQATPDPRDQSVVAATDQPIALQAVGAIADVALAPVQEMRKSPWLLRAAMLAATLAALAVWFASWHSAQPDSSAYVVGGVATTILVGNFMRWRRRWGWLRRALHLGAALVVLAGWTALLVDRALAGDPSDPTLAEFVAGSTWFWLPTVANCVAAALLLGHYVVATRSDRRAHSGSA